MSAHPTNQATTPPSTGTSDGPTKAYQPAAVEPVITAKWAASGAFHPDPQRVLRGEALPYSIVIPPPNVTGALHLGHALNNTLQDILTRAHRMMGYETLWMPGTDHAGIATQAVVEKRLLKEEGKRRKDFTREEFIARVQQWKDQYEARITAQLRAMGCSCDFDRQRFTMDDICARAVREAFFILFRDGLIYRGKRLVNWDPVLQTAVADDECYDEEVDSNFWYLRYPLESPVRLPGGETIDHVTVATTRPETYLGDSGVAMNPGDPRAAALSGKHVVLPLVGRRIPIVLDDYVVLPAAMAKTEEARNDPKAAFATGFLKVTPAHDKNDEQIGLRHTLAAINMMSPDGRVSDKHGWSDVGQAGEFLGKTMAEARKAIAAKFKELGLLEEVRPYRQTISHSDRSKAVIEPYLSDQWYVKVTDDRLAGAANRALQPEQRSQQSLSRERETPTDQPEAQPPLAHARGSDESGDGAMTFHPARYAKTFEHWHDNIRDWCISRQLWWGHRIPVWTNQSCSHNLPTLETLRAWQADGHISTALAAPDPGDAINSRIPDNLHNVCVRHDGSAEVIAFLEANGFTQDPDVLDTWFSSALWPMSTLGWPDSSQSPQTAGLLEAFNPTSVLSTAREIITLWVSRMTMMNRYLLGEGKGHGPVPFRDVFIHAVVQDGEGRKMSKSLGNGVDPLDIIESHGADAMRFVLCQMTTQTQDVRMPVVRDAKSGKNTSPKFDLGRNFCNKLWNASRFAIGMLPRETAGDRRGTQEPIDPAALSLVDRWMLSRLAATTRHIDTLLKNYEFSDYAEAMYRLLWWDVCDWYLEAVKPTIAASPAQQAVLAHALETVVRLLHPITPFITEAVWEQLRTVATPPIAGFSLGDSRTGLLCTAAWPRIDDRWIDTDAEGTFESLRELISAVRNARSEHQVLPKRRITLHASALALGLTALAPGLVETLAGVELIDPRPPAAGVPAVAIRAMGQEMQLSNLADAIDAGAEKERLSKQLEQLTKSEAALAGRLNNPGYAERAPAKLVEESKAQLVKIQTELAAVRERLKAL